MNESCCLSTIFCRSVNVIKWFLKHGLSSVTCYLSSLLDWHFSARGLITMMVCKYLDQLYNLLITHWVATAGKREKKISDIIIIPLITTLPKFVQFFSIIFVNLSKFFIQLLLFKKLCKMFCWITYFLPDEHAKLQYYNMGGGGGGVRQSKKKK